MMQAAQPGVPGRILRERGERRSLDASAVRAALPDRSPARCTRSPQLLRGRATVAARVGRPTAADLAAGSSRESPIGRLLEGKIGDRVPLGRGQGLPSA